MSSIRLIISGAELPGLAFLKWAFSKIKCKQFQVQGHETWVATSITVNLLPLSDCSGFDFDSS